MRNEHVRLAPQVLPVSRATKNVRRNKGYAAYELVFGVFAEVWDNLTYFQYSCDHCTMYLSVLSLNATGLCMKNGRNCKSTTTGN